MDWPSIIASIVTSASAVLIAFKVSWEQKVEKMDAERKADNAALQTEVSALRKQLEALMNLIKSHDQINQEVAKSLTDINTTIMLLKNTDEYLTDKAEREHSNFFKRIGKLEARLSNIEGKLGMDHVPFSTTTNEANK